MPVFIILFVIAFSFYLFYKMKYFRSRRHAERKWLSAKSNMALGLFIAFFGANQIFIGMSGIGLIIGVIFIALGGVNILGGYRHYRVYLPQVIAEAEQLSKQS